MAVAAIGTAIFSRVDPVARSNRELKEIRSALTAFYMHLGQYPSREQGLNTLRWFLTISDFNLSIELEDPWGNPYQYSVSEMGQVCRVQTCGADARPGGSEEDRDQYFELIAPESSWN